MKRPVIIGVILATTLGVATTDGAQFNSGLYEMQRRGEEQRREIEELNRRIQQQIEQDRQFREQQQRMERLERQNRQRQTDWTQPYWR